MPDQDPIIGSTATPTTVLTPTVQSKSVRTTQIHVSGTEADGITIDHTCDDYKKLASIVAVRNAANELKRNIESVDRDLHEIYLRPVISEPLATPNFSDLSKWLLAKNVTIDNLNAIATAVDGTDPEQAILRLNSSAFRAPGTHFIDLIVKELPIGSKISVRTEEGHVTDLSGAGRHRLECTIQDPSASYVEFVVSGLLPGARAVIEQASIYSVRYAFESYMEYVTTKTLSGGSGFATTGDLTVAVENMEDVLRQYINQVVGNVDTSLKQHLSANNPHGITRQALDAAATNHTHTPEQITGLIDLLNQSGSTLANLAQLQSLLSEHLSANNPHDISVTNIGAAPAQHTHPLTSAPDYDNLSNTLQNLQTQLSTLSQSLDNVITSLEWATDDVAIEGTDRTKYMNPGNTKAAIDVAVNTAIAQIRQPIISAAGPSGGLPGDIWFQYIP